ncbi:hypothetical protein DFH09DRAFT_1103095 [Mycena vulgaris]|nr:hypothetical protein DFH09DRAFT_1103095 [Mycena vulgaris]
MTSNQDWTHSVEESGWQTLLAVICAAAGGQLKFWLERPAVIYLAAAWRPGFKKYGRHAIARAVYARADLVLLDDVLSALDGETEAHDYGARITRNTPSSATFALASTAGEAEARAGQMLAKESATAATVVDEEQDEEPNWAIEQGRTFRRVGVSNFVDHQKSCQKDLESVLARHPSRRSGVSLRLHNSNRGVPNLADRIGGFVRGHRAGYPGFTQAKKGKKVRQDSITTAKLTDDTDTVSTSAVYNEPSHPDDIPDECELEEGECEEEYLGEVEEDNGFNMDASRERSD